MNRLIIIGNGFDLAHKLKTSYEDFINWYLEQRLNTLLTEHTTVSKDGLCDFFIENKKDYPNWLSFFFTNSFRNSINGSWKYPPLEIIDYLKSDTNNFSVLQSTFFEKILHSIETKGWVDIENTYYALLKQYINNKDYRHRVNDLNNQLDYIKGKLIEYLGTIEQAQVYPNYLEAMKAPFCPDDFSTEGKRKALDSIGLEAAIDEKCHPAQTMLLSFNYTHTANNYGFPCIYIHGSLDKKENIIFGYGDELDNYYKELLDMNDNALLHHIKSVRYLETANYHKMLQFIQAAPFQVFIMGHSCGNSDRTLLNTVFEHDNCVSIKPFYHEWDDGTDNYLLLVQNIARNFTNMKLYRDRVVNKTQCSTL